MQTFSNKKILSLALMICIGATPVLAENAKLNVVPVGPKIKTSKLTTAIGTATLLTVVISYLRLVTKKTAPKRVEPKDDSLLELLWYYFDELLVGQMEKGERPDKLIIDEDTGELVYKYSKIEARGAAGILYSSLKPVIIPALTLLVLFNKSSSDVVCGYKNALEFAVNPFAYLENLFSECENKSEIVGKPKPATK